MTTNFDVLADGLCRRVHLQGRCLAGRKRRGFGRSASSTKKTTRRRTATSRRAGRDGGVRQELAAGVVQLKPTTEVKATSILPSLNVKTARS